MISKLTLEQIKLDLLKSLDRYGIRIFFRTKYLADTSMNTCINIYKEKKVFGKKLDENELLFQMIFISTKEHQFHFNRSMKDFGM